MRYDDAWASALIAGLLVAALTLPHDALADHDGRSPAQYELDRQHNQIQIDRNGLQMRMNRQYQQNRLQEQFDRQDQRMDQLQQNEHMRNQGWGRPGLDGPSY